MWPGIALDGKVMAQLDSVAKLKYVMISSLTVKRGNIAAHRRHNISYKTWANIEKLLPLQRQNWSSFRRNRFSSTPYSGYCELGICGGICLLILVTRKIHINAFVDGEIEKFGKKMKLSLSNLI